MARLEGRVAVVTGASSGIGEATALALTAEGSAVVIAARRRDRLEALVQRIAEAGGTAVAQATDVTSEEQVERLFALAQERFGRLDLLVNNAGIADHTPTEDMTLARWREILDINLTSVFLCSRAAYRLMKAQKRGRILTIGSISAKIPRPHNIGYASTKAALVAMTHTLALDGRAHGITASILHPGSTITELTPGMADRPPSLAMAAEEVARMIVVIAGLPDETNVFETLMLPIGQPYFGRG
ncbi:MAG: Short-chain dehydrogenase/reductase [Rhodospirillales bacterium]|jgi:NAD(P)-dependent dehydrogenase (short-subunit alcohol dehydrogenase family)|nr:Short-chain dehydrogenase/reductase [Rhodospirillales bacterium]